MPFQNLRGHNLKHTLDVEELNIGFDVFKGSFLGLKPSVTRKIEIIPDQGLSNEACKQKTLKSKRAQIFYKIDT